MIINDLHIQGMFVYSREARYERGDFIIKDGIIYICTANNPTDLENNTVSNQSPESNPTNFTVYLGDKITTIAEYLDYVSGKSLNQSDKYVSSHVLSEILGESFFGFDESGIIDQGILNSIEQEGGGYGYTITTALEQQLQETSFNGGILDKILFTPSLNNTAIKISLKVEEVKNFIEDYRDDIDSSDVVILRQYTYKSESVIKRLQELIDPISGLCFYRVATDGGGDYNFSEATTWKSSAYNGASWKNALDTLRNKYLNSLDEQEKIYDRLQNNFCYRALKIEKGASITISCSELGLINNSFKLITDTDLNNLSIPEINAKVIDLIIQTDLGNNAVFKNSSLTLDLNDCLLQTNGRREYRIFISGEDFIKLTVTRFDNNHITLVVADQRSKITSIYYRQFYN